MAGAFSLRGDDQRLELSTVSQPIATTIEVQQMRGYGSSGVLVRIVSDLWVAMAVASLVALPLQGQAGAARSAPQEPPPPIDHGRAAAIFAEAAALNDHHPWPTSLAGPTLLADRGTRYVVANRADAEGQLRQVGDVWVGTLPGEEGIANTAVEWAGVRWTMVVWPLPAGAFERRRLLGHELFHRLSPDLGLPMTNPSNEHLDTEAGRVWLRAELRALVRALVSGGDERTEAIADALLFRARRHALFSPAEEEERALERNEGLAEYTGIHAALPPPGRAGWAAQRIESHDVRSANGSLSRNFAYATGPAYGLLLDDVRPDWQRGIGPDVDLAALLATAYGMDPIRPSAIPADVRLASYDGEALVAFERTRAEERAAQQAEFRIRYVEGPVLRLPVDDAFGYTFNPNGIATLGGVGQVLRVAEVRGGWGVLRVDGGVLLERGDRGVTAVVVPVPANADRAPSTGPGWSLELADGWETVPGARTGDWVVRPGQQ